MKIYDCFTFFNELDVLEIRLKYLYPYVDHFVLVESDHTHSGMPKPFYFEENKARFSIFLDKIIHIKHQLRVDPDKYLKPAETFTPKDEYWKLENEQRQAIEKGFIGARPNDIIMVSDVDEIPSNRCLSKLKTILFFRKRLTFRQKLHLYFINCLATGADENWKGTVASRFKNISSIQELRDNRFEFNVLKNAGWHFSYMGGLDSIIHKIESFAHTEYNKKEYKRKDDILQKIRDGKDIYNRAGHGTKIVSEINVFFPKDLIEILKQYPDHFIH